MIKQSLSNAGEMSLDLGKTIYLSDRKSWRDWLAEHHDSESEVWLIYYRKETGKPRISYNDAVEEALCYGWVDSTVRGIDEEQFAQRFSKRKTLSCCAVNRRPPIIALI